MKKLNKKYRKNIKYICKFMDSPNPYNDALDKHIPL